MISASLTESGTQPDLPRGLEQALSFLRREAKHSLADGKYMIDGERVFAMVQRYSTAAPSVPEFECHRKYIDVQYIVQGTETILCAPLERMTITEAYSPAKDVCFGRVAQGDWLPVTLQAGQFAVLFPADAHAPKQAAGEPAAVMKIVVKVAVGI